MKKFDHIELNINIEGSLNISDWSNTEIRVLKWHDLNPAIDTLKLIENFSKIIKKYNKIECITLNLIQDDKILVDGIRYVFDFDEIHKRELDEHHEWYSKEVMTWKSDDKNKAFKDIKNEMAKMVNRLQETYATLLLQQQQAVV